jgi:hypothetical protein
MSKNSMALLLVLLAFASGTLLIPTHAEEHDDLTFSVITVPASECKVAIPSPAALRQRLVAAEIHETIPVPRTEPRERFNLTPSAGQLVTDPSLQSRISDFVWELYACRNIGVVAASAMVSDEFLAQHSPTRTLAEFDIWIDALTSLSSPQGSTNQLLGHALGGVLACYQSSELQASCLILSGYIDPFGRDDISTRTPEVVLIRLLLSEGPILLEDFVVIGPMTGISDAAHSTNSRWWSNDKLDSALRNAKSGTSPPLNTLPKEKQNLTAGPIERNQFTRFGPLRRT